MFEAAGYTMLGEYLGCDAPVKFRCNKGHEHQMTVGNVRRGQRCGVCAGKHMDSSFVRSQFELAGYTMLGEYKNSSTPIAFRCDKGHEHQMSWGSFQSGHRCGVCAGKHHTTDSVKSQFELEGYTMIGEYVGNHVPVEFRCPQGHEHQMMLSNFNRGARCFFCFGTPQKTTAFVKERFESAGYKLLGDYTSAKAPIMFQCDVGHEHQMTWDDFRQGGRCSICAGRHETTETIKVLFESFGYRLLDEYVDSQTPVKFMCPQGHEHQIKTSNFKRGSRCGFCHFDDFYRNRANRGCGAIVSKVRIEIKRQKLDAHWSSIYSRNFVRSLAKGIEHIYQTCPRGYAVDHIVPASWFNLLRQEELVACWQPENLRHLSALENGQRHDRMMPEEIDRMNRDHPHIIGVVNRPYKILRQL
jgi:hypothetical protein